MHFFLKICDNAAPSAPSSSPILKQDLNISARLTRCTTACPPRTHSTAVVPLRREPQGVVRHLVETGQPGSIVNIISMTAHCGQSYLTAYSASKGALVTLTKNVANAFAANRIRCNGILTGWMDTPGESATQQNSTAQAQIG